MPRKLWKFKCPECGNIFFTLPHAIDLEDEEVVFCPFSTFFKCNSTPSEFMKVEQE